MSLIDRHIVRTFAPPFFFGLSVTTFLLMIDVLQRYVDLFLEKGIRLALVAEALVLSLGHIFALSVPMAVLVGTLMAVGHLAADNEITALKANGVSLYRISAPLLTIGLLVALAMVAYNNFVLPWSNHRLTNLLIDIHQRRPTFTIRENAFVEINEQYTIFVRGKDDKTGQLERVILIKREGRGDTHPDVIMSKRGSLKTVALGRIQLDLHSGEYHSLPDRKDPDTYHRTGFRRQTFNIEMGDDSGFGRDRQRKGEREMNLAELKAARDQKIELMDKAKVDAAQIMDEGLGIYVSMIENGKLDSQNQPLADGTRGQRQLMSELDRKARAMAVKAQVAESHRMQASRFAVEYHKKFAIPGACIVFVLVGVPLAVTTSRGGRGVSVGLSLLAYLVYYIFLSGGEKLADRGFVTPWLSMWMANLVLGPLGLFLLHQSVRETKVIQISPPAWLARLRKRR